MLAIVALSSMCLPLAKASAETESITAANSSINNAFGNVLAAQKAGGNVTQLLAQMNIAGSLLTQAISSYNAGNLANVTLEADNAHSIAEQVNSNAITLKNESEIASRNNLLIYLIFSISCSLILTAVLMLFWRHIKHSYVKKLPGLRPKGV
jgi:hypothetical protein